MRQITRRDNRELRYDLSGNWLWLAEGTFVGVGVPPGNSAAISIEQHVHVARGVGAPVPASLVAQSGSTDAGDHRRRFRSRHTDPVSYTHLRAHETRHDLVCRLLLEKKKKHT